MSANLAALLYLASGILFILALRGLSSPETARQGNLYGMVGMAIAIITTLLAVTLDGASIALIIGGIAIGRGIGAAIAPRAPSPITNQSCGTLRHTLRRRRPSPRRPKIIDQFHPTFLARFLRADRPSVPRIGSGRQ